MTELEKGYIAGIIDGEGSICLTKSGKWRHPTIQISSTTYEMLEYVQSVIGGTISKKSENGANCKQAYAYKIDYQRAIQVLQEIVEHLHEPKKKARAMWIIQKYDEVTSRNGRYSAQKEQAKIAFEEKFFQLETPEDV